MAEKEKKKCYDCNGSGIWMFATSFDETIVPIPTVCPYCNGNGYTQVNN